MDYKKLIRDASKIHEDLVKQPDSSVITKKGCKIYIPCRFAEKGLANLGLEKTIVGICAYVIEDKYYAISLVNAVMKVSPKEINTIKIKGEDCFELIFPAGSTVIKSTHLVKEDIIVYRIYDAIISPGKIPWFMSYEDAGKIFDTAKKHAGTNVGSNKPVTRLIISIVARNKENRNEYYRQTLKTPEDLKKDPAYISLKSVIYAATNTTNKLAGSYFKTSLVSALVSPSERVETIEQILRR